jgi:hypothetical protein
MMNGSISDKVRNFDWQQFFLSVLTDKRLKLYFPALVMIILFKTIIPHDLIFKRKDSYQFKTTGLAFFIGDLKIFERSTKEEAENKLVGVFPQNLQDNVRLVIRPVLILSEKHDVDPLWVLSVLWTESHFRSTAVSQKGARGLMQVMPETYAHLLQELRSKDFSLEADHSEEWLKKVYPETLELLGYETLVEKLTNLELGIYYLKTLHDRFEQNYFYATVAYNMGPSWTSERLKKDLPVGKRNQYLSKVLSAYRHITSHINHLNYVSDTRQNF